MKVEERTVEDKIVTESVVEKLKVGEDFGEEPKSSDDLAAKSGIVVESVDRSEIAEEVVEKSKVAKEVLEEPKVAEEIVEKPNVAEGLAEKTVTDANLSEKAKAAEILADKIMVDEADEGSEKSEGEKAGDKTFMEVKADPAESSKGSDFSVVSSKPSSQEEDDLGWDEIEDLSCVDEKKFTARGSPPDVRKRISIAQDDDEDLSWDVDD